MSEFQTENLQDPTLPGVATTAATTTTATTTTILLNSFIIVVKNPKTFISIYLLTTFPLSLLLFSLSLSSHPIKSHIYHLESLSFSSSSSSHLESLLLRQQSRSAAVSLLRLRALYLLPCYAFSLFAAITSTTSATLACSGKTPTTRGTMTAIKSSWPRALTTSMCVYGILLVYSQVQRMLVALLSNPSLELLGSILGLSLAVYLMAVMSLALVDSITEDRFGWDAIRVGWVLMKERRICGWILSGLIVSFSGLISWEVERSMDGWNLQGRKSTEEMMWAWDQVGLTCLFGLLVLWSYVVTTVYYCGLRRSHP